MCKVLQWCKGYKPESGVLAISLIMDLQQMTDVLFEFLCEICLAGPPTFRLPKQGDKRGGL
jgi:hypothetical protein